MFEAGKAYAKPPRRKEADRPIFWRESCLQTRQFLIHSSRGDDEQITLATDGWIGSANARGVRRDQLRSEHEHSGNYGRQRFDACGSVSACSTAGHSNRIGEHAGSSRRYRHRCHHRYVFADHDDCVRCDNDAAGNHPADGYRLAASLTVIGARI